jgi:hypothetical protein
MNARTETIDIIDGPAECARAIEARHAGQLKETACCFVPSRLRL